MQPKDASIVAGKEAAQKQAALLAELDAWVKPLVSYYKVPRYYVFTSAIPKSPSGKVCLPVSLTSNVGVRATAECCLLLVSNLR